MARSTTLRRRSGPLELLVVVLSLLLVPLATSQPAEASAAGVAAAPSAGAAESELLTRLNQERQRRGLGLLVSDTLLAATSRSWSGSMASRNTLSHDPNLTRVAALVEPAWKSVGENIGYGSSAKQLHDLFMGSTGHRNNMLAAKYNRVGIGVVVSGTKVWVTVRFLQGPAIAGSTGLGPPPPPPGVNTVVAGDFNGDGNEDVLTYGPGSAADELWFGRDDRTFARSSISVNGQYRPVAGDFDADGKTDILWYVPGAPADPLWEWNGSAWSSTNLNVAGMYSPFTGDFDGDGADDIFWYGPGTAADSRWYGKPGGGFTSVAMTVNGLYRPVVGDLDGQHGDDIVWYASGAAADYIWYANAGRTAVTSATYRINARYSPFTGDLDGNGTDDVFWYAAGPGADSVWYTTTVRGAFNSVTRDVTKSYLPSAADFDDDHTDDVLWFSPTSASGDAVWWGQVGSSGIVTSTVRS